MKKKGFKMPDTIIIIFFVVILAGILTYTVPKGFFETEDITYTVDGNEKTRTVIKNGTFEYVLDEDGNPKKEGVKLFASDSDEKRGFLNYMFEGLTTGDKYGSAVGVVAFILVIGGAFEVILKTGAIDAGILRMIKSLKGKEFFLIPVLFILFSLGGAVFGMGEESIPFVMIVVPMVIAMGYDSLVGVVITYCATQIGFATSWMNPFSVAIAQGISGIPVLSGASFRIAMWVITNAIIISYIMIYAKKVKRNPEKSLTYKSDEYFRNEFKSNENSFTKFTIGHKLIILDLILTMVWVIYGVVKLGYYIPEIATQFFTMGMIGAVIAIVFKLNGMGANDVASSFLSGAKNLLGPALVVGMAQGIIYVLGGTSPTDGTVLNTILNNASKMISSLSPGLSAWIMYIFQSVFNFFVVSGSGQASLTMPLMAPLADLAGVTRQVAVLAFQLGDGFTNLIVPTSGLLMAVIGAARIEWGVWAKFQLKMQGILIILSTIFIMVAVAINFA